MSALHISPDELYPADETVPPRLGASVAEWRSYRRDIPRLPHYSPTAPLTPATKIDPSSQAPRFVHQASIEAERSLVPWLRPIVRVCAESFNVSIAYIMSPARTHAATRPRHVAMYLARKNTHWSHPEIGRRFKRDHSCVHNAIDRIERLMAADPDFAARVAEIERKIMGGAE